MNFPDYRPPGSHVADKSSGSSPLNVTVVLNALRRWWKIATPISIILAVSGGLIVVALFEPVYQSKAWYRLRPEGLASPRSRTQENSEQFFQNQLETIRSPLVLDRVLKQPEIAKLPEIRRAQDPLGYLGKQLVIRRVGRSDLLTLEYTASSPDNAMKVLAAVSQEYLAFHGSAEQADRETTLKAYRDRYEHQSREVRTKFENVKYLARIAAVKDPFAPRLEQQTNGGKDTPAARSLAGLNELMVDTMISREVEEVKLRTWSQLAEKQDTTPSDAAVELQLAQDPQLQQMAAELDVRQQKLAEVEATAVNFKKLPQHSRLVGEIKKQKDLIAERKKRLNETIRTELQSMGKQATAEQLAQVQQRIEECKIREEVLRQRLRSESSQAEQVVGDLLELQLARDEYDRADKVLAFFATSIEDLEDHGMSPWQRVRLELPASLPAAPLEKFPLKKVALAAFALMAAPFGLAVLWEMLVRRVNSREDLEKCTGLTVLSEIPDFSKISRAEASGHQLGPYEESIDSLRTQMLLSRGLRELQILAVASSVSGEGKTSVAAKLAVSIVRASQTKTLLIDADIRRPDIHNLFDIDHSPGFGEVLAGKCSLDDAIVRDPSSGLDVLPAGNLCGSPHLLMSRARLDPLFAEIRKRYRHCVIDTPPVLQASESLNVHAAADGCLLSTMRDVTRLNRLEAAYRRLVASGAKPVGVVMNAVSWMQYAYRYGDGEYYYDHSSHS